MTLAQVIDLDKLERIAILVGPIGTFALLMLIAVLYFYRRDFLRKIVGLKEAHERRDRRDERLVSGLEQIDRAIERIPDSHEALARGLERLAEATQHAERQRAQDLIEILKAISNRGRNT